MGRATVVTADRLGFEQRDREWLDKDGELWHWNNASAQWYRTGEPGLLLSSPKDPDPLWFGPWTTGPHIRTEARKAKLLKLIAAELITLDRCAERHIRAQTQIANWREEYDGLA